MQYLIQPSVRGRYSDGDGARFNVRAVAHINNPASKELDTIDAEDLSAALLARGLTTSPVPRIYTAEQIAGWLTQDETVAIFTSSDPATIVFRNTVLAAREVRTDDARMLGGLDHLVSQGLLSSDRKAELIG